MNQGFEFHVKYRNIHDTFFNVYRYECMTFHAEYLC